MIQSNPRREDARAAARYELLYHILRAKQTLFSVRMGFLRGGVCEQLRQKFPRPLALSRVDKRPCARYNHLREHSHPGVCATRLLLPTFSQKDSGSAYGCQASSEWKTASTRRSPPCRAAGEKAVADGTLGRMVMRGSRASFLCAKRAGVSPARINDISCFSPLRPARRSRAQGWKPRCTAEAHFRSSDNPPRGFSCWP